MGATGVEFGPVEVTKSPAFDHLHPGRPIPEFLWMKVHGRPGVDDFGMSNRDQGTTVESPSWPEIQERIARLDARGHTMVTLAGEGEAHLTIGGGAGRYVVYVTRDNMSFDTLVDTAGGLALEMVVAGGRTVSTRHATWFRWRRPSRPRASMRRRATYRTACSGRKAD
jgi:hypothetical protein